MLGEEAACGPLPTAASITQPRIRAETTSVAPASAEIDRRRRQSIGQDPARHQRKKAPSVCGGGPSARAEGVDQAAEPQQHAHSAASSSPDEAAGLPRPEPGIEPAPRQQFGMAALFDDLRRRPAPRSGPSRRWSTAGARWRSPSCPPSRHRASSWIAASTSLSSAEVASSRIRIGASFRITRASATRCRCPPDSFTPRSPTWAS